MGRPYADRASAARHRESAQLDPVRDAATRWPHPYFHTALVLGVDSLAGCGVRLRALPRSGRELRRVAVRRLRVRAHGIHGSHRLAADPDVLRLDSRGDSLLP